VLLALTNVCFEGKNGHDSGVTPFPLMTHTGRRSDFVSIIAQAISLGVSWVARRLIFGLWSFAEPFNVGFRLLPCLVGVLAYLGNGLVIAHWFYVDDYTFAVGCANNPPNGESRIGNSDQKSGRQ
jgi:hypothetical protein